MIQLKNLTKTEKTYNLAPCGSAKHGIDSEDCLCKATTTQHVREAKDGTRGIEEKTRLLADSATVLGGGESAPLPDWVAELPRVKADVAAGRLRLVNKKSET